MEQMPASVGHVPMKVIELSDDEDTVEDKNSSKKFQQIQNRMELVGLYKESQIVSQKPPETEEILSPTSPLTQNCSSPNTKTAIFQQFWKAGDYDVQVTNRKSLPGSMHHVRVHPKFLHSNATSHKWAFGAIAELLDNAVDEIQNGASFVLVDKIQNANNSSPALLFQDDGGGMDPDCMRQCMSLGYSAKNKNSTIGQYGNGFKTSTMRLGADVIVFSRSVHHSSATQSIGLLSYTFLRLTGKDDTIVPMVDFELHPDLGKPTMLIRSTKDDWLRNLNTIMQWSPYKTENELMNQFEDIGPHGTKIIIFNLWLNDDGILELDFDTDKEDIRLRDGGKPEKSLPSQKLKLLRSSISYRLRYSLRVYVSILYLRKQPKFEIILRGKPVEHHSIADDLKLPKVITYKPQVGNVSKDTTMEAFVAISIGFAPEAPAINVHGFNVYHRNRLITPFWTIWPSNTDSRGRGVVGVLEANFIEPAHDKQDFERTALLLRLEARLRQMTADYWRGHCEFIGYQPKNKSSTERQQNSLHSPQVENQRSANIVPRGSISRNFVSHVQHVSNQPTNHSKIAGSIVAGPIDHNKNPCQETNTAFCGKYHVPQQGETHRSERELNTVSHATTSSVLLDEKPDPKLLSAIVVAGHHTQPNGLEHRPRSSEGTFLSGTLEGQIAVAWSKLKTSKDGQDKKSQANSVSLPSKFVEKLTESNLQLLMRCERYRHSNSQLNELTDFFNR
ncbi:protein MICRORCHIDIA 2 isoform X2 [Cryptomeria japonica]|uniref:protein MICRORCHIDIA 2 isoform X2 n=1 Tax=Cryptomeria japonica TaxID=3369 RepID=UPI0025AC052E|nr:protein MICRORCHIDIA 2 isoform X2 [Cryptomeria japonica]